jgi:ACR3 family arsenite transporter
VFQVFAFGALGWFYLQVLTGWLGLSTASAGFFVGALRQDAHPGVHRGRQPF